MKIFQENKKAFTLIELMIVVVILWLLMSTVLPKLTWWQARSRDSWREADLKNIVAALNSYYDDFWDYPWRQWKAYCLPESWNPQDSEISASHVSWVIMTYLQNKKVPVDAHSWANWSLCNTDWLWKYFYAPLMWKWLDKNSYLLCADVENYHNANISVWESLFIVDWDVNNKDAVESGITNYDSLALKSLKSWNDSVEKLYETSQETEFDEESEHWASDSVYCILRHN